MENMVKAEGLSDVSAAAAKLLDNELESLKESSTDGTDFFQTLVAVFSELRSESQTHLSNFYLSLPALMLSFAESLMHQKEKLTRRGKKGGESYDGIHSHAMHFVFFVFLWLKNLLFFFSTREIPHLRLPPFRVHLTVIN